MKQLMFKFSMLGLFLMLSLGVYAQRNVEGLVVDSKTMEPLVGAAVVLDGTTDGTITNYDGYFLLSVPSQKVTLVVKYVGYKNFAIELKEGSQKTLGKLLLEQDEIGIGEVSVTATIGVNRKTPVAMSTISLRLIEEKLGTQEFPEILKSTPGVYATKSGGGYGDSKINMRGFQSANVAVMVNGVPMNDMEWGGVYWSNWAGLSDVTRSLQTQRGLGASKVSAPSVGGSINVVTKASEAKKGGVVSYDLGNNGFNKVLFSISSGKTKNDWAFTLLGAKTWGDGYIQGTDFEGYNYFANISKKINDEHQLSFTIFGAPQSHAQRSSYDGLTIKGWQEVKKYMNGDSPYKYNPTYGFGLNGQRKNSNYNVYHKPQISLNHLWQVNEKSSLSTVAYVSIGRGYGYSGQGATSTYSGYWYGASNGVLSTTFRNADGTFAYDQIYDLNATSENGSLMAMSKSVNYHNWYGLVSTFNTNIASKFDVYGGIDLRYYKGIHTKELNDLYGGDYYIDRYRQNVSSINNSKAGTDEFANEKLQIGDIVYRDYDGFVLQEGGFGQVEYNEGRLSAFVAGSLSNTTYWRYDRFYYDEEHAKSKTVSFIGYTAKGGANFNIDQYHNVFANVGYISRAPFFSGGAFLSSTVSNAINPDAVNEKIFSVEVGYGFKSEFVNVTLNAYSTAWMDKTMTRSLDIIDGATNEIVDRANLNMQGVDALHNGIELEFESHPLTWLDLTGMLSIGDWNWNSNSKGYFYNEAGQPLADKNGTLASAIGADDHSSMQLNLKGVPVGGSAQTTAAIGAKFRVMKDLKIGIDYTFYARNYADWSFNSSDLIMNGERTYETSWKIPSAGVGDVFASYSFPFGKTWATISGNVNNVLNQVYIADAFDGGDHTWQSANRVFYGFGRTCNIRLKIKF